MRAVTTYHLESGWKGNNLLIWLCQELIIANKIRIYYRSLSLCLYNKSTHLLYYCVCDIVSGEIEYGHLVGGFVLNDAIASAVGY
jgi:hypothetical protein